MEINDEKDVYVVYTNTDCTEGRGYNYPLFVCELEATAIRLAKNNYIQGSNAPIYKEKAYKVNNTWVASVEIKKPTQEDLNTQAAIDKRKQLVEKAIAAGLTEEDIKMLSGKE